jgi:hypothetical protein
LFWLGTIVLPACGSEDASPAASGPELTPVEEAPSATAPAPEPDTELPGSDVAVNESEDADDAEAAPVPGAIPAVGCSTPNGLSGAPDDISSLMALLNALPRPTTIACFLESLERPLEVYFTESKLSAQPALDERSPRTFIVREQLFVSLVLDGASRPSTLLELGYLTGPGRSIKAEIAFPLLRDVTVATLENRVRLADGSICGGCHIFESRVDDAFFPDGAFESNTIKPLSSYEIGLESQRAQAEACDATLEPLRCANLNALFAHGEVRPSGAWNEED